MKKKTLPNQITILILTLLTAVVWVGLNIYRTVTIKPAAVVPETVSKVINPSLNTSTIQQIESAVFIPDSQIPPINIKTNSLPSPISIPTPTTIPTASPSGSSQI
jgi:hypothetical protein